MTNSLPGFDEPGLFEHPFSNSLEETHLAKDPFGEGYVVRYWNGSLCLPQTALYNNNALQWLLELIYVVTPHRLFDRCLRLDIYPSEYLLLRNVLDLEDWSLVLARVKPEVLAVSLSHLLNPGLYQEWIMMTPSLQDYGSASDPMMKQFYNRVTEDLNFKVEGYAKDLASTLKVGMGLDELPNISPLRLLHWAERGQIDLTALFKLCQSPALDACSFLMSRMHVYGLGLLHMATFCPSELERMRSQLGPIIDPTEPGADQAAHEWQMKVTAMHLADYTEAKISDLKNRDEDSSFTQAEFNALFNL